MTETAPSAPEPKHESTFALIWISLKGGVTQISDSNLALISAGVAFFAMLSLFPALAALIAVMSLISNPAVVVAQLEDMRGLLPREVYEIFNTQIVSLVTTSPDKLGVAGLVSLLAAVWSARAGVAAMMTGLNAVYKEPNRATASHYVRAILLTVALVGVGIVSLLTLVVAPVVLAFFPLGWVGTILVELLRWGIAISVLLAGVTVLYRFGPNRGKLHRRVLRPGVVFSVISWALLSILFSFYAANFGNYNQVYGSIGAVIAMLVWLWISSFLILLGAVVNAQIERHFYALPQEKNPFDQMSSDEAKKFPDPEDVARDAQ
ncbi:YihY/virulence factor BrkB family protein [Sulfitobacter sp. S190]|uniref:YihY/virulence factor BrkB family protein n=1 Tax=Sulfitobacter sp. S190 TaxID=2867022 RepID=UPI0021A573A3|nr:YihY/virulence factor BrkB family protein [Sulfitobacter sp. S190]UWR22692.1 YihY/virulence factor BrkB family protein [Sulfitobacter sp. S190]